MPSKKETLEEFLARGGEIKKIPLQDSENKSVTVKSTSKIPSTQMDLTMGEHFFAERTKRVKKERKFLGNMSLLPSKLVEFLRAKGKLS